MDSPEINRTIRVRTDQREEAHVRSFTRWINAKLSKIRTKVEISDLYNDLRDGHVLISLLEVLMHDKLPREKGKLRVHHATNVDIVLKTLEREKIKLHGISGEAIVNGNPKSTLGLVWTIILHYQVHGVMQEEAQQASHVAKKEEKPARKMSEAAGEDRLLRWVQDSIEGYDDVIEVKDLSKSWRNGMAFSVLIHVHRNDLIKLEEVDKMSNTDRLEHAFDIAEEHLNVERLLEPSDVDQANPDKKLVMMYVSTLSEALRQYEPVKRAKRRKVVEETMVATASSSVESSVPEPSEPFLQFKESLVQTSTLLQKTESDYAILEKKFENRIDFEAWENFEHEFKSLASEVENLEEQGRTVSRDSRVSSSEADEVRSDVIALETRWSSFTTRTQVQRNRIISIQNNEEKELQEWRKQMEIYLDWVENIRENFDKVEAMKSQSNVVILGEQAQELKRLGQALNTDQVPRQTLEHGRRLLTRNILSAKKQTDVKEQLIDLEKQLDGLNTRASKDIDRLNKNIDFMKQTQADQMGKWHQQAELMCDWMDDMDDKLEALDAEDGNKDTKNISKHLQECENLQEEIKGDEKPHSIMDHGEALVTENILSKDQKAKIEKQLKEIENEWRKLLEKAAEIKARLTSRREACELEEKHKVEEWIRKFEILMKQLTKVKETVARSATLPDFGERCETFQECQEVVETIRPDYQNAVECADKVLLYEACPDWEKTQIKEDVNMLTTAWKNVLDDISAEKKSMDEIQAEAANEQIMKIHKWQEKYNEVDKWYKNMSTKIEGEFTMGKTLPVVRGQITEHEALLNRMVSTHESVEDLLSTGQELLQNANTPDAEKNKLRKDIANLVERWESLSGPVNKRMERLSEMEKHLQENLSGKLDEWINQATYVEGCLTKAEKKFQSMGVIAPNLEAAMKQKPRAEALLKEVKQEEKKLNSALRVGEEILADASMSDQDNAKLQQELNTLKNRWEALDEKISWRVKRLDETISRLGSQQNDKLEKWRESASEISDWLDKAQLRLAERGPIGSDLKSVTLQKEEFQVFLDESLLFQRHIYEFTEFGENLRTDPCISEEERVRVQQKTKSLNERWDVIVQQINNHHNALDNRVDELEEKHQNERVADWKSRSEPLQKWLTAKAIEAKSLKEIGSDILTVQRQLGETKVLKSRVENYGKQFREVLAFADEIGKDDLIEDDKAQGILEVAQDMTNRWSILKHDLEGRVEKLSKKQTELLNEKSSKVSEWGNRASNWKEWLKNKENSLEVQGTAGAEPNIVKKQKDELESLTEEVNQEKENFDSLLVLADEVLAMKSISDDDRRQIQQDRFTIKSKWESLRDNIDWKMKRLSNKEAEFDRERTAKIQEWRSKVAPLQEWIKKQETKCERLQSVHEDVESATARINEIQRLIADTEQKEKQLNIILRLGDDVLQSPSLSDEDRTALTEDTAKLKEKWKSLTDETQSILQSLLQKNNELDGQKRAKFAEWRATAAPLEEWLVEEGKKFDGQSLTPGANIDVVKKKREETELIFNEMLANEKSLSHAEQIYEDVHSHPSLSIEDKRKLQQEMNKIKTTWKNLEDKMETAAKRIADKESDLEKERENYLADWQMKRQALENWMSEREDKLQNSDEDPGDLDQVRKQIKNIKESLDEFHIQLKDFRILSRLGDEAHSHPSLYEQDQTTVRDELTAVKTRRKTLEENMNAKLKRLTEIEGRFLETRANDMTEWKDNFNPVKDWIAKQEKKILTYSVTRNDHDLVIQQRQEVEVMLEETKNKRDCLADLETLSKNVQLRPSLSEDDKKKVQQDLNAIKNNWNALEDAINQTHDRISKQEGNFNKERVTKMEEWRYKSAPLEQLFSEQGTKWEDDDDMQSTDLETLRKYRQATQIDVQTIQKQQVELENAMRLGDEVQKHTSLRDEDRSKLRMEMSSLKSQWQSLEERMHRKMKRLSSREVAFNEERSNKLGHWKNEVFDLQEWLAKQEKRLAAHGEPGSDLESIRKHRIALESQLQEVQLQEKQLQTVMGVGNDAQSHASMSEDDRKTIQQDITMLENYFKTVTQKIEERIRRVSKSEKGIQRQKDSKLEEWRNKLALVEAWLAQESKKLDGDGSVPLDLDTVASQRREMQDIAKEMELQEKKQLTGVIRFGEDLKTHATLSNEDRRRIQEDIETLKGNWENLREKMNWKIKRLSEKEAELKEQGVEKLQEWKSTMSPLQEWLSKEEQKTQESLATDMINLKRQKQECLGFLKELELQGKRVDNVVLFGEEIAKHPSISEENKRNIEQCIITIKNDWERLNEKTKWRLTSAEEKAKDFEKERVLRLEEWTLRRGALQSILSEQENAFKIREGIATDLETVKYKKSEIEDMLKELELEQKKELNNIVQFGEDVFSDPSMSLEDNRKIKQDISNLKTNFENLEEKMKWRAKRLSEKERELEQFRAGKLAEWKTVAESIGHWLANQSAKFQLFEDLSNDLDEVREQKAETEAIVKEMDAEKNEVNTVVKMGDQLLEHPSLFDEDQKLVEQQLESIQNNWHVLFENVTKRLERIVNKEAELDIEVTRISMEWRIKVTPLREWISEASKTITEDSGIDIDLDFLRRQKAETESITKDMDAKEEDLRDVISFGYKMQENPLLSNSQKGNIQEDSANLKKEWDNLETAVEERTKSLNKSLRSWEQEQESKLSVWRETCRPLSDWLDQADPVICSTDVDVSDMENTSSLKKKVEALLFGADTIGPKFLNIKETAESFQQDPCLSQQDRRSIKEEAEDLSNRFSSISEGLYERKNQLSKSLELLERQYQDEKLSKWNSISEPITMWLESQEQKLHSLETGAEDLTSVQKQQEEADALVSQVTSYKVQVENACKLNDELCEDPLVNDKASDVIAMQAKNIRNKWRNLKEAIQAKSESLSMRVTTLLNERQRRLSKWSDEVSPVAEWLSEKQELLLSPETESLDTDTARKQKNEFVDLVVDLQSRKELLEEIALNDLNILHHPSVPEDERKKFEQELTTLQRTADNLTEKAQRLAERLKEIVRVLETEGKEKLKEWRDKMKEVTDELNIAEKIVTEKSVVGADIMTVRSQKETLQGVLTHCLEFQEIIYEFTNLSDNLRKEACISGEEKTNIAVTTESLNKRWDLVLAQLKTRNRALEEQLEDLEEEHIAELLGRWEEKYGPFSVWLSSVENEVNSLKDLGDNAVVVRKQQKETENLISKVANHEPIFKEVLSVVHAVNNDPLIEDDEAKAIDKLADSLISRWGAVNDTIMTRAESLRIRESFLNEQEQHLLHEWRRSVEPFNNWLSNVEEDGALKLRGNVGVNTIKDYSVRFKTLEREIEGRKPVLEEIERLGRKLLEDPTVRDEEKSHIKEEMEILKERWEKLHVTIHDNTKWADIKLIELAKKEQETLDVWRKNVEPFNTWLEETSFKLEDIKTDWTSTENLKDKHLALQKIKEDVTRHEEALARIVTIADKLTDDENVSENEKGNIKAEMNRLQDKWNTTQNNVNLNYLSVTESLMELAQKERETLEQWKKQTDSFKEWVVEAKGRFDNALRPGEGYDVVSEQKEKLENLSRELAEKEKDFGDICELKTTILQDDHLSSSFKDNIKTEAESLDQKWNELRESISLQSDRAQKQMISLEGSQRTKLDKWQNDFRILNTQQNETEDQLKTFETLPLDVDNAKKQCADLKVVEQKIEINRSRMEEVSSFCAEIAADPNVSKKEKTRIKKDIDMVKERQSRQERTVVDRQRRLDSQVRELQDRQSAKLENWRTSSQPLHEWLDGIEDDAREYDVMLGSIVDAQVQFDELQKLSKEFKETEPDLFNVLKLGEELSTDPQVSEDVREGVSQDVKSLRENHGNVSELIKSQREKTKSQLLKLRQHQEKCLIDWNQRKSSIDARIKTMEKRTRHLQPVGDNFEDVQAQKDEIKTTEKELESIEWELTTVLEYGQTLCKDKSIIDGEKEEIRAEMKTMETALYNSRENVEQRKLDLNSKLEQLRKARANEFLTKWRKSSSAVTKWMDTCQEGMAVEVDDSLSLAAVRERLDDIDELSDKVEAFEPEFSSAVKDGEDVIKEPSVEASDKEQVENQLLELKERWKKFNVNLDSLMSSLEDHEMDLSKGHDQESKRWHNDVQQMRDWCRETETRLQQLDNADGHSNYEDLSTNRKELQVIAEMLPKHEVKLKELEETSEQLSRDSKDKSESENYKQEIEGLQNDFDGVKQTVESLKSNYDVVIGNLESEHGQKLSEWNKRDERIERQLVNIERQWQDVSHLENASEDQMQSQRPQLEAIVSDLNDLQPDFDRHISSGRQLSNNTALSSETRTMVQDKLSAYSSRWETLQIPKRLLSHLPRVAVVENVVKIEDSKQVESIDDAFDDLFGIENDGPVCQELIDWYVEYDAVLKWCVDAETRIERLRTPGEYIVLVEKQHGEIEETIQTFTAYEITVSKVLDKGNQILSEQDMLSKDDIGRLEDDIRLLKTKWDDLQEKAFDTERSLNEHVNKLQEYQDWREKASALSQWLEMTHRKMDCCSTPSDDLEEREKQRIFLQKFSMEKHQNEESIKDVLNLGRYIVTNHLVLKEKYDEVNADVKRFKNIWNQMLSKADDFCKIFGIEFSHIDLDSSDPLEQWREKVKELEKWLVAANEKLNLKRNLKDYSVLKQLPEDAKDISQGIDNYCVPQLNEITSKGQDILNSKKCKPKQNAEIADTIASLSEKLNALRVFTESQKVHFNRLYDQLVYPHQEEEYHEYEEKGRCVRNATLAYFNKKLNASESTVESVLENLKKLKTVGTQAAAVKDQVDLIKNSEEHLQQHVLGFEEYKKQLLEMEDKGYLSSDGFEGTLKVKTAELEPKLMAVEKQFADTKNRLAKGVVNFHGQHKDEVKKWLKICEKKLNEIDSDADDINRIYEEYCKIQELRREMMKGEKDFLNTLELNERLIAEEILNEKQGKEYQAEIQSVAKWRNSLQRRVQEKDSRLYVSLVEGLNAMLMSSIHSFEEVESTFNEQQLSPDFDTATEQMDATKHIVENTENLKRKARGTLELSQKITTMGILLLKESDKGDVEDKVKQLMEYCSTLPGKARDKFNRLLDDYLVLFKKEIEDRKNWIAVNENKMSSSYMEIENLAGFEDELKEHKEFEQELNNRNMEKMSDAAERVPELERHLKIEVRNITKRSNVLKQWADDYSLDLQRVVKDWNSIQQRQKAFTSWLDPQEERLSKLNEKINCIDREGVGQEIQDLKDFQSELEEQGVVLSKIHVKGMELMKFLNDEAAASRTIDQELAQLDRRWNAMAKELLARIELLRNIELKQGDIKQQKEIVNKYIDETNTELDEHETKTQRLRGNVSQETIVENGETAREKKVRLKKEREFDQQELNQLVKNLEEKVANFPNYQSRVDRINSLSRDLEDVADDDSKASLHEELVTFNARWQVIVTRLEAYSDNDLPDHTSWGCMGFVRRRLSSATL